MWLHSQGRQRLLPLLHRRSEGISSIGHRPRCFSFDSSFFVDISLPFGLRWAASHCQDVTTALFESIVHGWVSVDAPLN